MSASSDFPEPADGNAVSSSGVRPIVAARASGAKPVTRPGIGLGIASIFFSIVPWFGPICGLAAAIGALSISTKAGIKNPWAVAGIVVASVAAIAHVVFWTTLISITL